MDRRPLVASLKYLCRIAAKQQRHRQQKRLCSESICRDYVLRCSLSRLRIWYSIDDKCAPLFRRKKRQWKERGISKESRKVRMMKKGWKNQAKVVLFCCVLLSMTLKLLLTKIYLKKSQEWRRLLLTIAFVTRTLNVCLSLNINSRTLARAWDSIQKDWRLERHFDLHNKFVIISALCYRIRIAVKVICWWWAVACVNTFTSQSEV